MEEKALCNTSNTQPVLEARKTKCSQLSLLLRTLLQWNLDLTKSLGTGQICSLNGGFVISRFFSIHFTVTLAGTEIISFVISRTSLNRGSLNRGSTVQELNHGRNYKEIVAKTSALTDSSYHGIADTNLVPK